MPPFPSWTLRWRSDDEILSPLSLQVDPNAPPAAAQYPSPSARAVNAAAAGGAVGAVAATASSAPTTDEGESFLTVIHFSLVVSHWLTMNPADSRDAGGADLASSLAAALAQRKGDMGDSDEEESEEEWD